MWNREKVTMLMPLYGLLLLLTACGKGAGEKKTSPTTSINTATASQESEKCSALRVRLRNIDEEIQSYGVKFSQIGDSFRMEKTTNFYLWDPGSKYSLLVSFITKVDEFLSTCIDLKNPSSEDVFFYYKMTKLIDDRNSAKRVLESRNNHD